MTSVLIIVAFMIALGSATTIVALYSPFSTSSIPNIANPNVNLPKIAGCDSVTTGVTAGNYTCGASVSGGPSSSSTDFFSGLVSTTQFVFGNFFVAAQFLINVVSYVVLPGAYVSGYLGCSLQNNCANPAGGIIGGAVQSLVWYSYGGTIVYFISGRVPWPL